MVLDATYLGSNGWLLDFSPPAPAAATGQPGPRVLVDPWFTGPLVFPPGPWLLRGELGSPQPPPERIDLLLITQGLPDHCHPESLALLDRRIPVVAAVDAVPVLRRLGFETVVPLRPGEEHQLADLRILATTGAAVPKLQNGYLLEHPGARVYLEPHGAPVPPLDPSVAVDVLITPVVDLSLVPLGTFIAGRSRLPALLSRFRPHTVLASTTGGDVRFEGVLQHLFRQQGTLAEAAALAADHGARLIDPVPGSPYRLEAA